MYFTFQMQSANTVLGEDIKYDNNFRDPWSHQFDFWCKYVQEMYGIAVYIIMYPIALFHIPKPHYGQLQSAKSFWMA